MNLESIYTWRGHTSYMEWLFHLSHFVRCRIRTLIGVFVHLSPCRPHLELLLIRGKRIMVLDIILVHFLSASYSYTGTSHNRVQVVPELWTRVLVHVITETCVLYLTFTHANVMYHDKYHSVQGWISRPTCLFNLNVWLRCPLRLAWY